MLRDFSLDVSPGKSLAIVGASGCGKSSLVRLLLRLHEPDAGAITLAGTRIDAIPVDELRSMIAVVPQDLALLNGTIRANIALGMGSATRASIADAARLAKLHDFVAALPNGYETVIGERGLKLSGGERQRIAIARAILRRPRLFILDEATSMLDAHTEQEIMQNLLALSQGHTLILIAHRLATIRHADEIAVLAGGGVVERGDHATLMALGGTYAAMWQHQTAAECRC
ncbi:ATP-binding cassette domain-containing protein [Paucibacter sp. O1-1]|nr:ATP-binding cassette domain-containing protein [Paucibacter sp. O1-1]MDA3831184.1 ATP-binding cassette domain-containing protein [Paucibacter sp. O1-1]